MLLAGVLLGKADLALLALSLTGNEQHGQSPIREAERRLHRIGKAGTDIRPHHKAVKHHVDAVLLVFIKADLLGKLAHLSVHAHADVAAAACLGQHLLMHALLTAHDGREDHKARALGKGEDLREDVLCGLLADLLAADGTVRHAEACV